MQKPIHNSEQAAGAARYSQEEWQTRVDLAACYRIVQYYGWTSQVYNHITARIPGTEHILINPFGLLYEEITPFNLVKIDLDGNKLDDSPYPVNAAGYVIHSAIHTARPDDVMCVLHTHSENATVLSCIEVGFVPLVQEACMFHDRIGYHEFEGVAVNPDERERLARDLGTDNHTLVLYNHGVITTGPSIPCAFARLYYFETAAGIQLKAMASGRPLRKLSDKIILKTREQFDNFANRSGVNNPFPEWPAYLRMLDRLDPDWRNGK
jgi:ribulose-5-phosphate 4-epimerase/fuculose-1-phosphate aldolase